MCRSLVPPIAPRREQWPMTAQAGSAAPTSQAHVNPRDALRQQLRHTRRQLPKHLRVTAALKVAAILSRQAFVRPNARIGVYLALPSELDLEPFFRMAWSRYCKLFVPRISHMRRRQMTFHPLTATSQLKKNRWHIPELKSPYAANAQSGLAMDVVLVPMVGFDAAGNRLGMGAGFYDRHFASLGHKRRWRRPKLIGIAFSCQQVAHIPAHAHDVGMDAIITERCVVKPVTG